MADVTISDVMRAYAADAVAFAKRRFQMELDYSENSLADIDRVLADYTKSGLVVEERLTPEQMEKHWIFCKMLGGYVGEVIIRNMGGTWQMKDIDENSSSVALLAAGRIEGSPPQAVWRSLTELYKGGMASYYRTLMVALGQGEESFQDGIRTLKLPPLSGQAPENKCPANQKPWWKFW